MFILIGVLLIGLSAVYAGRRGISRFNPADALFTLVCIIGGIGLVVESLRALGA